MHQQKRTLRYFCATQLFCFGFCATKQWRSVCATSSGGFFWSSPNEIHITCVWHDSFIRVTRLTCMCVITYSHVCYMTYFYVGYGSSRVRRLSGVPQSPIKLRAKWQHLAKRGCVFFFLWDISNWVYIHTLGKYICIYIVYIYVYIYVYTHICLYIYMYVYIYTYIYTCIRVYTYTCICIDIYIHIYIYTHMYIYICIILYDYIYTRFMYVFMNFIMLQRNSHVSENTHACRFFSWEFLFFSVRKRCSWDLRIYIHMNFHSYVGIYRSYICKYKYFVCVVMSMTRQWRITMWSWRCSVVKRNAWFEFRVLFVVYVVKSCKKSMTYRVLW